MAEKVTPYKNSELAKKQQVREMFNTISTNYDKLNRVISFGIDTKWREKVICMLHKRKPKNVLDIATGTGDLVIQMALNTKAETITGLDISSGMLDIAEEKITKKKLDHKITMVLGDSEKLPFKDNSFDAITVAFGVRNFENLEKGLSEIYRTLRKGGVFIVLETSKPTRFFYKQGYNFYTKAILPLIGRLFSKDRNAYGYLSKSAAAFPFGEDFNNILGKIGFIDIEDHPQTFGVATIYLAIK